MSRDGAPRPACDAGLPAWARGVAILLAVSSGLSGTLLGCLLLEWEPLTPLWPLVVFGAVTVGGGAGAGLAYWLVTGWSSGRLGREALRVALASLLTAPLPMLIAAGVSEARGPRLQPAPLLVTPGVGAAAGVLLGVGVLVAAVRLATGALEPERRLERARRARPAEAPPSPWWSEVLTSAGVTFLVAIYFGHLLQGSSLFWVAGLALGLALAWLALAVLVVSARRRPDVAQGRLLLLPWLRAADAFVVVALLGCAAWVTGEAVYGVLTVGGVVNATAPAPLRAWRRWRRQDKR